MSPQANWMTNARGTKLERAVYSPLCRMFQFRDRPASISPAEFPFSQLSSPSSCSGLVPYCCSLPSFSGATLQYPSNGCPGPGLFLCGGYRDLQSLPGYPSSCLSLSLVSGLRTPSIPSSLQTFKSQQNGYLIYCILNRSKWLQESFCYGLEYSRGPEIANLPIANRLYCSQSRVMVEQL